MKPRELYSGPAPAAQAQMGAGILEAGANIGRSIQSGYESIGKSIGAGLQAVGGAYGDYKKMQSQVKADANAFQTLRDFMPKDVVEKFDMQERAMNTDPNTSLADKHAFYGSLKGFLGQSVQQKMDMDKLGEQLKVQKVLGLGNIIAPYSFGGKGTGDMNSVLTQDRDPNFQRQPTLTNQQPQASTTAPSDEVNAFMAENPTGGSPADFEAWRQKRAQARKQQAGANMPQADFGLVLPR
jgi:hypothetical protein